MSARLFLRFSLIILFGLHAINALAQQLPALVSQDKRTPDGRYNFLKFKTPVSGQRPVDPSPASIKLMLGLGIKHNLVPDDRANNSLSKQSSRNSHTRYQQYFNGLKVEFAVLTTHKANNNLEALTGEYFTIPENFSVAPTLSEAAALDVAMRFIGGSLYSWQDKSINDPLFSTKPKAELLICRDYIHANSSPDAAPVMRLAYKIALYSIQPLRYENVYVDAINGKILLNDPIIKHVNGTAATRYSGSRTISTSQKAGGGFTLKDTVGNYNIATWNMNHGSNYNVATEFLDSDNNWTAVEFDNTNFDNAALDAHWGAMMTLDYFRIKHNRNSYNNNGARLNSYVHYGTNYSNSFWNGAFMTYGDGNGVGTFPFTSVDICGHEIAHAICEYTAGLFYSYESGALNESLSDIWGACIEKFAAPEKNPWLLATEISSSGTPLRSMIDPNSNGQPDTYQGSFWYTGDGDNGGVHYNSGVMNHWFYILSEGKSGTNDHGRTFNVSGIGMEKAAAITYRAETMYLFPSSQYGDARVAMLLATEDLFGINSNEYAQVGAAWTAVGVYQMEGVPLNVYLILNAANNVQINWALSNTPPTQSFIIERAINESNVFTQIAIVDGQARSFIDSFYVANSINKYRIKSISEGTPSNYSSMAFIEIGNAPFVMKSGAYNLCNRLFLDPGAYDNYKNLQNTTTTFTPSGGGNKVRITFNSFRTEQSTDYLKVYNGPNTSSLLIGQYSGSAIPPTLESTASGGELTFVFTSNNVTTESGWEAYVTCIKPLPAPSHFTATLNAQNKSLLQWIDNARDETSYMVERSVNDSLHFSSYVNLPPNSTNYTDVNTPDSAILFYRIKAVRDTSSSQYPNITGVLAGNHFYLMKNGTVNTCSITFFDPGGPLNYINQYYNYTTTFTPSEAGKKLRVLFSSFKLSNLSDYLRIYNGPTISSPLIGSYTASNIPPEIFSTAANGELTFQFYAPSTNSNAPGWRADISCYDTVGTPSQLTTQRIANQVQLNWIDNATNETKYILERAVSAPFSFVKIAELPANSNSFLDNALVPNSQLYYRVIALRDTTSSQTSNTAIIEIDNGPVITTDIDVIGCGKTFLDPGGIDKLPSKTGVYTAILRPQQIGDRVKLSFSMFKTGPARMDVYDGPTTASPKIVTYYSYSQPSSIVGSSSTGALTVVFTQTSVPSNLDSGWVAQVSCFKDVAKATGLTTILGATQQPQLSWIDNADDEAKYIVERSVNSFSLFQPITELPANTTSFTDNLAPANSLLVYRIIAKRDSITSPYSDSSQFEFGTAPFLMGTSGLVTCDRVFLDGGGVDRYPPSYEQQTLITPAVPGNKIRVVFSKFKILGELTVYNGTTTSDPKLGRYTGSNLPPALESSSSGGSLLFIFSSSLIDSGWVAQVSCIKQVTAPSATNVVLDPSQKPRVNWVDNADDETRYIIERSLNGASMFVFAGEVAANITSFIDNLAPDNNILFYRVRAVRDTLNSTYSNSTSFNYGNIPFLMKDSVVITCDELFYDGGGSGNYPGDNSNYTVTFTPPIAGYKMRVAFSQLKVPPGSFYIYDGPSISSPLISNSYSNPAQKPVIQSSSADGSITFRFTPGSSTDSGWLAQVTCFDPINRPTGVTAIPIDGQKVQLTWNDNSNNESKFVIERSVNAPSSFVTIAEVPQNVNAYIDSTVSLNSFAWYRIRAVRDVYNSFYSDSQRAIIGNSPYLMKDSTVITCNTVFLDPGGVAPMIGGYHTTLFRPSMPGYRVRVTFSKFSIGSATLRIWNGSQGFGSNLIGTFGYNSKPPVLSGTNPDGALLFYYDNCCNTTDSGWVALVECYKVSIKPSGVTAVLEPPQQIRINWNDNSTDETKFVIERSVNSPSLYQPLGEVAPNITTFVDNNIPANSKLYYRIRSYIDTAASFSSDTAIIDFGNAPYLVNRPDTTLFTCDRIIMDYAGLDKMSSLNEIYNTVLKPAIPGHKLRADLLQAKVTNASFSIHNGNSTSAPKFTNFPNYIPLPPTFQSTAEDGSITIYSRAIPSTSDSGFIIKISCYRPAGSPTNLTGLVTDSKLVQLLWQDNSNDETKFVVQRAFGDTAKFMTLRELAPNSIQFTDSTAPDNTTLYYRVIAFVNDLPTDYTNRYIAAIGFAQVNMTSGTISTCNVPFYDAGGFGTYKNDNNYTLTFIPASPNNKLKVVFSSFELENGDGDTLRIYNGPSTASPLIGTYVRTNMPPPFESTAIGGELTFEFVSDDQVVYAGWEARVFCAPPKTPDNFTVTRIDNKQVGLHWQDNNLNEDGVMIERSVADSVSFVQIAQLPANSISYIDTSLIFNVRNYYRVRTFNNPNPSGYTNAAFTEPIVCSNPTVLASTNARVNFLLIGSTKITDENCKLFANIQPYGNFPLSGIVRSSFWYDENASQAFGLYFVKRRFQILPDIHPLFKTGLVTLYFTQAEFDNYNSLTPHAKLPISPSDSSGINNVRIFVSRGASNDQSGSITSYSNSPDEIDPSNVLTNWNSTNGYWEISVNSIGFGGMFLSSRNDTTRFCTVSGENTQTTSIKSNVYGSYYQWQRFNGTSFVNISDNINYSGTQSFLLQVKTASIVNEDKFRCIVNGVPLRSFVFTNAAYWTGVISNDWTNPLNWSCGSVPGPDADIVIEGGKTYYPSLHFNVTCRSLKVKSGATIEVQSGYNLIITNQ